MDIQWLLQMPQQMTESDKSLPASLSLRAGDLLKATVLDVEKGNDALLAFGQFKAYGRLPLPVVTGQDIQIRVEASEQGLRMVMLLKSDLTANVPVGEGLAIRLFEPVTDRIFLSAHSRALAPGESLLGRITGFEKNGLKLVDFGEFKAFVKIDIPVRQGQTIPLTVVQTDEGIALAAAPKARPRGSNGLPPSRVVGAAALDPVCGVRQTSAISTANHPTVPIPSSPAVVSAAATTAPASPPTSADLAGLRDLIQQVTAQPDQMERNFSLPPPTPVKTALVNLLEVLAPASPMGEKTALVNRIRDFVENSGIYFEKRLEQAIRSLQARPHTMTSTEMASQPAIRGLMVNDLKPNLLILNQFLDNQPMDPRAVDRHMLETLKSVVQRVLYHTEKQQFMATEKPVDADAFQVFSHLLCLADTRRNARFKVYYARKGRGDAHKNPRVSLLLDLDRMGTVRTDLWMVGKDLNVTFYVKEVETKLAIEAVHHRIGEMLTDIFNTVSVSVVVSENKRAEFEGEDLYVPNRRLVDLSI